MRLGGADVSPESASPLSASGDRGGLSADA